MYQKLCTNKNNLNESINMYKDCLVNDQLANGCSMACFFSFHRRLENNKIIHLDSGAFSNLPGLFELYV